MLKTRRALVIAVLVHAGVLGTLGAMSLQRETRAARSPSPPSGADGEDAARIPIDLVEVPSAPVDRDESAKAIASVMPEPRVRHDTPSAEPQLEPEAPVAPSGVAPSLTRATAPASIGIALGAPNAFALSSDDAALPDVAARAQTEPEAIGARPKAPTPEAAKENVEASFRRATRDHDRTLGVGPEGPVLTALREATMGSTAPVDGRAVFTATADSRGVVESLVLDSCDGSRNDWEDAARLAHAALQGRTLRVAALGLENWSKRVKMKIEVFSALKMPSGHDTGVDTNVLGLPVHKGNGKRATKVAVLNPIPRLEPQNVTLAPGVVIKVNVYEWDVLTIHGDPVDLGAKPIRVIQTRLVAVSST